MSETIRNLKDNLSEPWEIIAGMAPYLKSAKQEGVLKKTIFLPYGAIEMEPAFPATNMGFAPVHEVLDKSAEYTDLGGWMGNNELMLLQFPRTYYFLNSLWDGQFKKRDEGDVVREISGIPLP